MGWEIRIAEKRYRLRNKRLFYAVILLLVLLAVGVACIAVGMLASARGGGIAPDQQAVAAYTTAVDLPTKTAAPTTDQDPGSTPTGETRNGDWQLTLVNANTPLPQEFHVDTRDLPNGLVIDARIYNDLMKMFRDAKDQGMSLVFCSAYRSYEKQRELFDNKVARIEQEGKSHDEAYNEAKKTVAQPGTSEHNLGLAVDIVALSYQLLDEGYLNTAECKWLKAHSWEYGFIMRYPEGKSDITNIIFEPWHYRYVGAEAAKAIHESGQCLEEYLDAAK